MWSFIARHWRDEISFTIRLASEALGEARDEH
jgi:hypothetical protein